MERLPFELSDHLEQITGLALTDSQIEDMERNQEMKRQFDQWVLEHPNKKNVVEIKKAFNEDLSNPLDLAV